MSSGPAVLVMPSPQTLRAPAVWVTARNWARGLEDRFGEVLVCLPHRTMSGAASLEPYTRPQPRGSSAAGGRRDRRVAHRRVLAKDLLLLGRRSLSDRSYQLDAAIRPAVVWQHHDLLLRGGERLARRSGAPLVHFVDALQVWEARKWGVTRPGWGSALERWGELPQLRHASAIACVSTEVADVVAAVAPGAAERVVVTPCTADARTFSPELNGAGVRAAAGLGEGDVVFGWIGSFRRFHGVSAAVEALARILPDLPNARLLLVGDGDTWSSVHEQVQSLGLREHVVLTGAVPHAQVPQHIAAFDVALVTASKAEGFHYSPLKLREYLVSGKAVIAPRAGQIAKDFRDGTDLLLYDAGDTSSLAAAMLRVGADHGLRAQVAERGRARELAGNSIASQLDRVLAVARGSS